MGILLGLMQLTIPIINVVVLWGDATWLAIVNIVLESGLVLLSAYKLGKKSNE